MSNNTKEIEWVKIDVGNRICRGIRRAEINVERACDITVGQVGGSTDVSGLYVTTSSSNEGRPIYERDNTLMPQFYMFYKTQYQSSGWVITDVRPSNAIWYFQGGFIEHGALLAEGIGDQIWRVYDGGWGYTNETITVSCV